MEAQPLKIRFTKIDDRAVTPSCAHDGDAGYDLYAVEEVTVAPGGRASVGTGLTLEIPFGWAGLVLPRSGLAIKHGITVPNAPGLIDAGYRGELRVLLLNSGDSEFSVAVGDRIGQLMITAAHQVDFIETDTLSESDRGAGGFGSSGA